MKSRQKRQDEVKKLKVELENVSTVILTTFQGITVQQDTDLRRAVKAVGGDYQVIKNTLGKLAAAGTPVEPLLQSLKGTNSIAFTQGDPVALAKALTRIAKEVEAFKFKAGIVEGRVLSISAIQALAMLPSKEELISKIMFLVGAPAQHVASALAALPRNLAATLNEAVKEKKVESGRSEPAPAGATD